MIHTPSHTHPRLAIGISGSGTNLQAVIDAIATHTLRATIALVFSNRKTAYGLTRAQRAGIETLYFPMKPYAQQPLSRETYDADLATRIAPYTPDYVVLLGWMHIFTPAFLMHFPERVLNLHPALPGMFPGTHAIERAFESYQRGEIEQSGCMVHLVVPEVDAGPVIAHATVPIQPDDTLATFEARMHAHEHRLVIDALSTLLHCG